MSEFATIFLALIFETTPFLLAGVLIAALAGPAVERALGLAAFRQPAAGMLAGAGAGLLLPMCDCGSRPLAHRLALAGRRQFAIAFLVAAPVVNPIVIITTWLAFRSAELLALRLGLTVLMAFAVAIVLSAFKSEIAIPAANTHDHGDEGFSERASHVLGDFFELFQFLVFGSALAALIQVFVDTSIFSSTEGIYLTVIAMLGLAFLLSICSSVDAFVVAGLAGSLGTGAVLAFLTFGPLVNLKSMPMYVRLFRVPAVVAMTLVVTQMAFVGAIVVEFRGW